MTECEKSAVEVNKNIFYQRKVSLRGRFWEEILIQKGRL